MTDNGHVLDPEWPGRAKKKHKIYAAVSEIYEPYSIDATASICNYGMQVREITEDY